MARLMIAVWYERQGVDRRQQVGERCRIASPAQGEVRVSVSHSEVNLCDTKNAVPLEPPCCRLRPGIMRSGDSRQVRLTLARLSVRPWCRGRKLQRFQRDSVGLPRSRQSE
jgi:hypothetical protein